MILGWIAWVMIVICVAGFLGSAGMLALSYVRGEGPGRHVTSLVLALVGCIVIGAAGAIFLSITGVDVLA